MYGPLFLTLPGYTLAMGKLTTHILDTSRGRPGNGIVITLFRLDGDDRTLLTTRTSNSDGRCDEPLQQGEHFTTGIYELVFATGAYLDAAEASDKSSSSDNTATRFLDDIVIRFGVAHADEHYHVPLLLSAYGYSTYRGS